MDGRKKSAKVSLSLISGEDGHVARAGWVIKTSTLIISKEEQLVLDDRAAYGTTEQIPAQGGSRNDASRCSLAQAVLPLISVELVVAEELKEIATQTIGARLEGGVNNPAVIVPKIRRGVLGNKVELSDRVRRGRVASKIFGCLVVVDTVQQEIVGLFTVAIDVGTTALFGKVCAGVHALRIDRDGAWGKKRQLDKVTSSERKIVVGFGVDDGADLRVLGLQNGRGAGDLDGLSHLADFHCDVDPRGLIEYESERRMNRFLETRRCDFDLIRSDRHARQVVGASVVGFRGPSCTALDVRGNYGCRADRRSARIGYGSYD